ncbi:DUF4181 domain-containing protein [Lysinibacillus sphaericus]
MYTFFIYITISGTIFFLLEWLMRKKLKIPYKQRTALQDRFPVLKWIERGFWTLLFVNVVFYGSENFITFIIFLFFTFDLVVQWKYNRSDKEYIISLMGLIFFIIFIVIGNLFGYLT